VAEELEPGSVRFLGAVAPAGGRLVAELREVSDGEDAGVEGARMPGPALTPPSFLPGVDVFRPALEARFGPSYEYFVATPSDEQLDKLVTKIRGTVVDSDVTCDDSDVTSDGDDDDVDNRKVNAVYMKATSWTLEEPGPGPSPAPAPARAGPQLGLAGPSSSLRSWAVISTTSWPCGCGVLQGPTAHPSSSAEGGRFAGQPGAHCGVAQPAQHHWLRRGDLKVL
jgi:hypothetical protein